jgi:hypothetical protein
LIFPRIYSGVLFSVESATANILANGVLGGLVFNNLDSAMFYRFAHQTVVVDRYMGSYVNDCQTMLLSNTIELGEDFKDIFVTNGDNLNPTAAGFKLKMSPKDNVFRALTQVYTDLNVNRWDMSSMTMVYMHEGGRAERLNWTRGCVLDAGVLHGARWALGLQMAYVRPTVFVNACPLTRTTPQNRLSVQSLYFNEQDIQLWTNLQISDTFSTYVMSVNSKVNYYRDPVQFISKQSQEYFNIDPTTSVLRGLIYSDPKAKDDGKREAPEPVKSATEAKPTPPSTGKEEDMAT